MMSRYAHIVLIVSQVTNGQQRQSNNGLVSRPFSNYIGLEPRPGWLMVTIDTTRLCVAGTVSQVVIMVWHSSLLCTQSELCRANT